MQQEATRRNTSRILRHSLRTGGEAGEGEQLAGERHLHPAGRPRPLQRLMGLEIST
jgi:hypothetical protein